MHNYIMMHFVQRYEMSYTICYMGQKSTYCASLIHKLNLESI